MEHSQLLGTSKLLICLHKFHCYLPQSASSKSKFQCSKTKPEQLSKPSNNHWSVPSRPPPSSPKFFESKTKNSRLSSANQTSFGHGVNSTLSKGDLDARSSNASTLERNDASQKRPQFGNQVMLLFPALVFVFHVVFSFFTIRQETHASAKLRVALFARTCKSREIGEQVRGTTCSVAALK